MTRCPPNPKQSITQVDSSNSGLGKRPYNSHWNSGGWSPERQAGHSSLCLCISATPSGKRIELLFIPLSYLCRVFPEEIRGVYWFVFLIQEDFRAHTQTKLKFKRTMNLISHLCRCVQRVFGWGVWTCACDFMEIVRTPGCEGQTSTWVLHHMPPYLLRKMVSQPEVHRFG